MTRVAITDDFLRAYAGIPKSQQNKVRHFMEKFRADPTPASINYEPIHDMADDKVRTVRIDKTWRAIVIHPPKGDVYVCVHVGHHDKAMAWAKHKRFDINPRSGAFQIYSIEEAKLDQPVEEAILPAAAPPPSEEVPKGRLFAGRTNGDLYLAGVPQLLVPAVRALKSEAELDELAPHLPVEAVDALYMLAAGLSLDEAIREAMKSEAPPAEEAKKPSEAPEPTYDPEDFGAALDRPVTQQKVKEVVDDDELRDILAAPLEMWRIFLHPTQRSLVTMSAHGPVRVLGGAGTGKTVVAMHRAKHLAKEVFTEPDDKILFTTFTANLAADINLLLDNLCGPEIERIFVVHLDRWAATFLRNKGARFDYVTDGGRKDLMGQAWELRPDELKDYGLSFFLEEWREVVLANGIVDKGEYLSVPRTGRGRGLNRKTRLSVWKVFEAYRRSLQSLGKSEREDALREACAYLEKHPESLPYCAVVADEVQDLSPIALKLLRQIVPEGDNDMFVVGDAHQRIYANRASLGACGINIRGRRGKRLRINYRTTEKIRDWAVALLKDVAIDDLDGGKDTLKGYRSLRQGVVPEVVHWDKASEEKAYVVEKVKSWQEEHPGELMCVVARTHSTVNSFGKALNNAGIDTQVIDTDGSDEGMDANVVRLGTMHRVKGLEFPRMIIAGVEAGKMPLEVSGLDNEASVEDHLQRERSLLFVAATRARDELVVTGSGERSPFVREA